ncbi:MAG: hypothetical protein JNN07_12140 [Verrucomicrobiales bacterium]|nr:hypothetical protein [Verrucomicrobiales bacterium]
MKADRAPVAVRSLLQQGLVIPAHPLALTAERRLDEKYQRALTRYYHASGAGGIAVGVHTTQFEIREPAHGLLQPVLQLAVNTLQDCDQRSGRTTVRIAGICGEIGQAMSEALLARELGYQVGLVALRGFSEKSEEDLVEHCRQVAQILPIMGFYLQAAVGGRRLSYRFWRRLCELEGLAAIKVAPFNRYQTQDVLRAVVDSGRGDVALYTGNDDNILLDLLCPGPTEGKAGRASGRFVGGLLGQWAVWTAKAVSFLKDCTHLRQTAVPIPPAMFKLAAELTDANAALFDAANGFGGCIAGIHEALRRQGLMRGVWCLNPRETLGPGQLEEIDRIWAAYPHLRDDEFVERHRDSWLS